MSEARECVICADLPELGGRDDLSGRLGQILIERLRGEGREANILITDLTRNSGHSAIRMHGSEVKFLSELDAGDVSARDPAAIALRVYRYVRDSDYDRVHILLPQGAGGYCAMARRQGLIDAAVITYSVEGSEAKRRLNVRFPDRNDFVVEALERAQYENSDLIVAMDHFVPSMIQQGKRAGPRVVRVFWPTGEASLPCKHVTTALPENGMRSLIILADQDHSAGIDLLVEAVKRLPTDIYPDLIFVGRFGTVLGEHSGGYILRHLANYPGKISFLAERNDRVLTELFSSGACLAIIPARGRDCSWEFASVFGAGVPFLTFGADGAGDHVAAESLENCTTEANPDAIAEAMVKAMRHGMPALEAAYSMEEIESGWTAILGPLAGKPAAVNERQPLVSVCMTHYERPALLSEALAAIARQTYDRIEVIVVDDGSTKSETVEFLRLLETESYRFPLKIIYSRNRYLGAARNLAASHAQGVFLLFHDDDNIAEPHEIETLVNAVHESGADILTCLYWTFENGANGGLQETRQLLCHALGQGGPIALLENRFGDANALVRRTVFEELGGFSSLYAVGYEDWEFFFKAYLRGYHLALVPEPLFNYRISGDSMVASNRHDVGLERVFSLLDKEACPFSGDLARFIAKETSAYHSATQFSRAVASSAAHAQYLQLAEHDANAEGVPALLSEIARIEGRPDDPAERIAGKKGASMAARAARASTGVVHQELPPTAAFPAAILIGWGIARDGLPVEPRYFRVDGRLFEVCAIARHARPDVNEHLKIPDGIQAGFFLAGRLVTGLVSWRHRLGRSVRIGTGKGKIDLWGNVRGATAHVDQHVMAEETRIAAPPNWTGILGIDAGPGPQPFAKYDDGEYRLGTPKSQSRTEFIFAGDNRPSTEFISVISPKDATIDLFFRCMSAEGEAGSTYFR